MKARPSRNVLFSQRAYQLPPLGQAPLPVVAHVRVMEPDAGFVIVNVLPDSDFATTW